MKQWIAGRRGAIFLWSLQHHMEN